MSAPTTADEQRLVILSRIDDLLRTLLQQLVAQSNLLDPSPAASSSSITTPALPPTTTESIEGSHRPAKRKKKESRPKLTPLSLRAEGQVEASGGGVSFPTKSLMGVRRFVLVVEKEAVFKHLVHHQAARDSPRSKIDWDKVVFITGKGYPDYATRALVRLLCGSECPQGGNVNVAGLFDGDPWGVDVHRHYTFACPEISWIGVDVEDFLPSTAIELPSGGCYPLVPLRNDERVKAVRLLRTLKDEDGERERRWRDMLTRMLLVGYKVEIEAAYDFAASDSGSGGLTGYLERKLFPCTTS
ncbi:uncharacterized protein UTRI_04978_B [Ustilago trichophora]|uniref:Topoisomerase 6 subunit A/Spo11 TOPRIM domain-containing protein n=1 Tax=Ustilago trichophora TaxID=86804 RepID=A0A5C3EE87_9BASI|nr:uncharacterized protein UTRI_04978_B [Ustilago trichophora]